MAVLGKLEPHRPLTSSTHIHTGILCVLTHRTFQKEIDNTGRYGSDQCESLWCLWGLNPLCRPWLLAKPISSRYHVIYRFLIRLDPFLELAVKPQPLNSAARGQEPPQLLVLGKGDVSLCHCLNTTLPWLIREHGTCSVRHRRTGVELEEDALQPPRRSSVSRGLPTEQLEERL